MVKREKRLKKGISSIEEQIKIHEEKMKEANADENLDLEGYYKKEIEGLKKAKDRKEKILDKK